MECFPRCRSAIPPLTRSAPIPTPPTSRSVPNPFKGGFVFGDKYEFGMYAGGARAAKQGVIIVEPNYRLGSLGFLALPELFEANNGTVGNYGTQDQAMALRWVQAHGPLLGGDPAKVALWGESAGGMSVCWHLASPGSIGLFNSAIIESGSCSTAEFFFARDRAYGFGKRVVTAAGCDGAEDVIACLRAAHPHDLFVPADAWNCSSDDPCPPFAPAMSWGPTIDGSEQGMPAMPIDVITTRGGSGVPLIMGTNENEGASVTSSMLKVTGIQPPITNAKFALLIRHFYNDTTACEIVAEYLAPGLTLANCSAPTGLTELLARLGPAVGDDDQRNMEAFETLFRDWVFLCSTRNSLLAMKDNGWATAFEYVFNLSMPNWPGYRKSGNSHGSELPLVWDNQWPPLVHRFDVNETWMAAIFGAYWGNLPKYGSANNPNTTQPWPGPGEAPLHWNACVCAFSSTARLPPPLRG